MKMIQLRNGHEEAEPLVRATLHTLKLLKDDQPIAFHDFVMKCREHSALLFGDNRRILEDAGLIQDDGRVHGSIRDIVLSAVDGDGLDMVLRWPAAGRAMTRAPSPAAPAGAWAPLATHGHLSGDEER